MVPGREPLMGPRIDSSVPPPCSLCLRGTQLAVVVVCDNLGPVLNHGSGMLPIDLKGKRALVAGVADDGGFGFAIAKALAEAGATVSVATWPPAMNIFESLLERGKLDSSMMLARRSKGRRSPSARSRSPPPAGIIC